MPESFVEKRKRELGMKGTSGSPGGMSFVERRKIELGMKKGPPMEQEESPFHESYKRLVDKGEPSKTDKAQEAIQQQLPDSRNSSAFRRLNAKEAQSYDADKTVEKGNVNSREKQLLQEAKDKKAYDKLPKIRKIIADVVHSPIGKKIMGAHEVSSDVLRRGLDSASLGVTDKVDKALIKSSVLDPQSKKVIQINRDRSLHSVAGKVGTFAGYLVPGAMADRLVVTAGGAALKGLPKVARGLIRGGAAGTLDAAAQEGGDVAFRGGQFDPLNVAIGGGAGGVLGAVAPVVGKAFRSFMNRGKSVGPEVEQQVHQMLALPAPKPRGNVNTAQTPDVIFGTGRVQNPEPLALPQGNVVRPTRLKPAGNDAVLDSVMQRIRPIVTERMTPPYENTNELAKWVQSHLGVDNISLNEIRQLSYEDLRQMAELMRGRLNVGEEAHKAASELGYNLDELLNGKLPNLGQRVAQNAQERVYGVYPESLPNVKTPQFNRQVLSGAGAPLQRVGRAPNAPLQPLRSQMEQQAANSSPEPMKPIDVPLRAAQEAAPTSQTFANTPQENMASPQAEAEQILQSVDKEPRIRDRVYQYLDEAEAAARERLAKSRNRLSSLPIDQWSDHSIIMAAKLGKGTIKATDFTEELVKEFGEQIRPHAQTVLRKTNEYLRQQERRASKEGQDAVAFNDSGVGDAETFSSKISTKPAKKKTTFARRFENTRTQLVDDQAPFEGLEKRIRGHVASAEDSLYKAARMFKGVPEKAALIVQKSLSPIIKEVEKAGHTARELSEYALARHAKDVNAAGYKSGFTNAEIDSVLRKYGTPEMEIARQALVEVNKTMLRQLVDNHVISKELQTVLNERWQNYIPLFRAFDDEAMEFGAGLSKALANVTSPIKALQGSERAVIDPLENMVKNIFQSINAAERNKVALQLPKLAELDVEGKFIRRLGKNEDVGRKNVVNVKINGENVKYEVEPEVYKAVMNLDQESANMLVNVLSKPASWLRAGATLTPEFSLRNPMRDINQAFTVSKSGFNPLVDFPVGVVQAILGKHGKGKLYQDWVENLGAYGNVMSMDRNVHKQALEKVLGEPASKKFVNVITGRSLIALLRSVSDMTESATKIGEYRAAIRRGATPQEAAYRSRDIMDFARAGSGIRQTNKVVAFLNANIQGNSRLIRAIKENPVRTTTKAFVSVTLPTVGVFTMQKYLANDVQKETIDNAPRWQKDTFWLVPMPHTDTVARIPKPFGLNLVFANPVERLLEKFWSEDNKAFDGFAQSTMSGLAIPTQISGLMPFIEGMSNYSFFKDGNIIPKSEQSRKFGDQYDPIRTSEAAKVLAKGADKLTGGKGAFKNFSSPRIMDNTIQGLTAGLGKYATDAIDSMLVGEIPFTGLQVAKPFINRPEAPSKSLEQKPFIRSFVVDPNQGGKAMDDFYNAIDELSKEKASNKFKGVTFGKTDFGRKDKYLPTEKDKLLKELNEAADVASEINTKIRALEKNQSLTPDQKRDQIRALMLQRAKIIKETGSKVK